MAARDIIVIGVVLFSLAIAFFAAKFMTTTIADSFLSIQAINSTGADTIAAFRSSETTVGRSDYLFGAVFLGLMLSLIITGWFVAGNPLFIFVYFLVVTLGIILSAVFSNTFQTVTAMTIFGTTITSMPIVNHIMGFLPIYIACAGFIGMVIIFGKPALQGDTLQ